ncbi:MAG: hypothetical protein EOQ50_13365 [Mesorhizobium sp.]|uniref:tyrosine-type recombinase/integrase n=1 Tax=Mesorhizobium sp. TaxID=1871066 RepID=UPI000FEA3E9C|nr:tyrosine-type recombinase/integrase [Mesorhizobium sp.]RWB75282.1 MAG: hypothetical protein EOQ50_13365 [Mesorhizobium sp.]
MLDRFIASKYGAGPIAGLQAKHVNAIIDEMASTPAAASNFRKRLSAVMDYAVSAGMRADNPVKDAKRIRYESDGHRNWTEEDISAYRKKWKMGTPERLAMEVLLHTGLRRSDAVRIGWKHVAGGRIEITAQKTGAELSIPIRAELIGYIRVMRSLPRREARHGQRRPLALTFPRLRPRPACRKDRPHTACARRLAVTGRGWLFGTPDHGDNRSHRHAGSRALLSRGREKVTCRCRNGEA